MNETTDERNASLDIRSSVEAAIADLGPYVTASPGLQSLLYEIGLLPEQVAKVLDLNPTAAAINANRMAAVCHLWRLAYPEQRNPSGGVQVGDLIRDNDPRTTNRILVITSVDAGRVTATPQDRGRGKQGETRISQHRVFTDGKSRRSGWSLMSPSKFDT